MIFSRQLTDWYISNKRDLPWRDITDPYKIWISEIILQQTRVRQGLDYYDRFVSRFPDVISLSEASEDEVLKLWQGLGYYSRARNLHAAAQEIVSRYGGIFPDDYESVLGLKGIGEYTAAAVCSFAYNQPYAVVDGNVYRVLSRVFNIETPIDTGAGKKVFADLATELLDKENPAIYNQAIMDFGATVCVPVSPDCGKCPLCGICIAFSNKTWNRLPVKKAKIKQRDRFFYYFYIKGKNGKTFLHKREEKDIWRNLYEFPLMEAEMLMTDFAERNQKIVDFLEKNFEGIHIGKSYPVIKHVLSHQQLFACFIEIEVRTKRSNSNYIEISEPEIGDYAISRLTDIFLTKVKS